MKLYHGSDNQKLMLKPVKSGKGYHPGSGPVEFLGPSFSDDKETAGSYGKYIFEIEFTPKKSRKYRSLNALKNDIIKIFGLPSSGHNVGDYYRDIADSYRVKLLSEGYDVVIFPEGMKTAPNKNKAITVILLNIDSFPT